MSKTLHSVAPWAVRATFLLSLVGLAISTYLTITHFEKQLLLCSSTGTIDCAAVTSSPQSYVAGIPVAALGLGFFVAMTALNSPWGWRLRAYWPHVVRFGLTLSAMAFVLWLVGAELLIIDHICLWCTGVHVVTFALFAVLVNVAPTQLGWTSPSQ